MAELVRVSISRRFQPILKGRGFESGFLRSFLSARKSDKNAHTQPRFSDDVIYLAEIYMMHGEEKAWKSKNLWNGQMDVPPAGSFPYFNGMDWWRCLGWQLPILQRDEAFYAFSSVTEEGGLVPNPPTGKNRRGPSKNNKSWQLLFEL